MNPWQAGSSRGGIGIVQLEKQDTHQYSRCNPYLEAVLFPVGAAKVLWPDPQCVGAGASHPNVGPLFHWKKKYDKGDSD